MDLVSLNEKIGQLAGAIAAKGGFEFVRSEIGGTKRSPVVRVFIDREDGLTVEHCADVSRELDERMDELDLIPTKYVLEVSSPGIEREISTLSHFQRFKGKLAKIKTKEAIEGSKTFTGNIGEAGEASVELVTKDGSISIPFDNIDKANLKIDLGAEFGRRA